MGAMPNRIFLIGYMGSGKTTVSKILSRKTEASYIDMDQEIEKAEGMPIRKMFILHGEHEFRNKESELLDKLCRVKSAADVMAGEGTGAQMDEDMRARKGEGTEAQKALDKAGKYDAFSRMEEDLIVSCGGGVILDGLNRLILHRQYTIFLETDPEKLFERVNGDANRPFAFMDVADENERRRKFLELYKKREPLYKEAAAVTVQTDGKTPEEVAAEILELLKIRNGGNNECSEK